MKINWKSCLEFSKKLTETTKFKKRMSRRPIIIGRKNNHAASYYLSKHTNLLPNININNDNDKGEKRKANNYLKNDEVIIK